MISYEIYKKKPQTTYQHIRDVVKQAVGFNVDPVQDVAHRMANQERMAEGEPPVPWLPAAARSVATGTSGATAMGMGKHGYAKWLNEMVYPQFHKNCRVTLRKFPYVLGQYPPWWSTIVEIQEIHYMVEIDRNTRDPKALGLAVPNFGGPVWYPPCVLRPLYPEESDAIDRIRNQEAEAGASNDSSAKADPASSS